MIIDTPWMPNVLGGGDVAGPASATDNAVARFDGTTGKLIQNSTVTIDDSTGAIAGAQSLTSPASINLTLGTGTSGAAITVLSASNNVGIGTASPGSTLTLATVDTLLKPALGLRQANALGYGYDFDTETAGIGRLDLYRVSNNVRTLMTSWRQDTGNVSIASTTAGSSGAGALVVAGGISAAGASYFGGAIEAASLNLRPISNSPFEQSAWIKNTGNSGVFFVNSDASKYAGLNSDGTFATNGVISSSGATFAGAVTIAGNVGFYGQAATAKPTGVAVTAAAIHAALVTLNLIAA